MRMNVKRRNDPIGETEAPMTKNGNQTKEREEEERTVGKVDEH
jgi:hypothetical protein